MFQVIVAEDELWIRDAVVEMVEHLTPHFHVIGEAGNGEDAWNLIHEGCPHILITDIMMPKKNGLWLCEQIYLQQLPIVTIIVSGYDNFQYAKQAMRFGITDYLLKPLDEAELKAAMTRCVERLEGMAHLHQGVHSIQTFVQRLPELPMYRLQDEMRALFQQLLKLSASNLHYTQSLFTIWSSKWNELLSGAAPDHQYEPLTDFREASLQKYFERLCEVWMLKSPYDGAAGNASIHKICEYIASHYFENFSLGSLADQSHLSVSYFSALFKKTTGHTLLNYLNMVRIRKAKELMQEPDLKIYEIAEMIGYSSMPYFNRIFKQIVGVTPMEYRKRLRS